MKLTCLATQKSIIKINNLYHYFGKNSLRKPILTDINLDLKAKETVILTGPSGSGKNNAFNFNRRTAFCSSRKS